MKPTQIKNVIRAVVIVALFATSQSFAQNNVQETGAEPWGQLFLDTVALRDLEAALVEQLDMVDAARINRVAHNDLLEGELKHDGQDYQEYRFRDETGAIDFNLTIDGDVTSVTCSEYDIFVPKHNYALNMMIFEDCWSDDKAVSGLQVRDVFQGIDPYVFEIR